MRETIYLMQSSFATGEISPEGRIAGTDAAVTVPNKLGEGV